MIVTQLEPVIVNICGSEAPRWGVRDSLGGPPRWLLAPHDCMYRSLDDVRWTLGAIGRARVVCGRREDSLSVELCVPYGGPGVRLFQWRVADGLRATPRVASALSDSLSEWRVSVCLIVR